MRFLASGHPALGWRCSQCSPGWEPGPEDPPEAESRLARNCEGRHDLVGPSFDWAPGLRQCPWAAIPEDAWDLAALWREWSVLGTLPFPGPIGEQPLWVHELLTLAQTANDNAQAAREAKSDAEQRGRLEAILGSLKGPSR